MASTARDDQRCADITFWYPYPIRIRYQVSVSVSYPYPQKIADIRKYLSADTYPRTSGDDPSIGGGHVCWGAYDGFNFAGWRSRCVPGMHRDHNTLPSQTDRRTLTS